MRIKIKYGVILALIFFSQLLSCSEPFTVQIDDLNGVWADCLFYNYCVQHPEEETEFNDRNFSWGKGKTTKSGTNEFDLLQQPYPIFFESGIGAFRIKDTKKYTRNSISLTIYRFSDEKDLSTYVYIPIILHFIDVDTFWIESEYYNKERGRIYQKNALWHKISGPPRIEPMSGVINDARVRIRTKPNLDSDTWGFLNTGDNVTIVDKSENTQVIGDHEAYWYKVDAEGYPDGWVFGQFIKIE